MRYSGDFLDESVTPLLPGTMAGLFGRFRHGKFAKKTWSDPFGREGVTRAVKGFIDNRRDTMRPFCTPTHHRVSRATPASRLVVGLL